MIVYPKPMFQTQELAIVIPTFNEAKNIKTMLEKLREYYPYALIVVVDDSSPDGTAKLVASLAQDDLKILLIKRPRRLGLASAYKAGFNTAIRDKDIAYVAEMDADFSHDPIDIGRLLDFAKNSDIVIGSRYVKGGSVNGWAAWRRLLSKAGNLYARRITGVPIKDLTSGMVVYKRDILSKILENWPLGEGYSFQISAKCEAYRHKAKISEVPIAFRERREGKSKMTGAIIMEAIGAPWRIRFGLRNRDEKNA